MSDDLAVGWDFETTGLHQYRGNRLPDRPFSCAFHFSNDETVFLEWDVDPFTRIVYPKKKDLKIINEICGDPKITKMMFHGNFDRGMATALFQDAGKEFKLRGPREDALYMFKCLRSDEFAGLKDVCERHLGMSIEDEGELHRAVEKARRVAKRKGWMIATKGPDGWGNKPQHSDYWLCRKENKKYNMKDAERHLLAGLFFQSKLKKEKVYRTYKEEMRLHEHVFSMRQLGVHVRRDVVKQNLKTSRAAKVEAKAVMSKIVGYDINPKSPIQLNKAFKKLGITSKARTETGWSTGFKNIQHNTLICECGHIKDGHKRKGRCKKSCGCKKFVCAHPFVEAMIQHNSHFGAIKMFEDYLRCMVKEGDLWIIHPTLNQMGPKTGRFSSQWPNLQNVRNEKTVRSSVPIKVRSVFGPRPGYSWLLIDYSQIEVWLFAVAAAEKYMLRALLAGRDIHAENALKIWKEEYEKGLKDSVIMNQVRTRAKMVGFGIVYGAGPSGIMNVHGCLMNEAKQFIDDYLTAFPNIRTYQRRVVNRATRDGYVRTMYGRKLMVPRQFAYRGIDYEIQGTGADIMKRMIRKISDYCIRKGYAEHRHIRKFKSFPVLTVHDELMLEVRNDLIKPRFVRKVRAMAEDHEGFVKRIPKLPVKIDLAEKAWDVKYPLVFLERV